MTDVESFDYDYEYVPTVTIPKVFDFIQPELVNLKNKCLTLDDIRLMRLRKGLLKEPIAVFANYLAQLCCQGDYKRICGFIKVFSLNKKELIDKYVKNVKLYIYIDFIK
jgi:hypothetical protein